jgi:hypothetical protein
MSTTSSAAASGSTYAPGHADVEVQRQGFAPEGFAGLSDFDGFVAQFRREALAVNALITMPPMITAWAQVQR